MEPWKWERYVFSKCRYRFTHRKASYIKRTESYLNFTLWVTWTHLRNIQTYKSQIYFYFESAILIYIYIYIYIYTYIYGCRLLGSCAVCKSEWSGFSVVVLMVTVLDSSNCKTSFFPEKDILSVQSAWAVLSSATCLALPSFSKLSHKRDDFHNRNYWT